MTEEAEILLKGEVQRCALDRWRFERGLTIGELAQALKVSPGHLGGCFAAPGSPGYRRAGLSLRLRAAALTDGDVALDDWPDHPKSNPCAVSSDAGNLPGGGSSPLAAAGASSRAGE